LKGGAAAAAKPAFLDHNKLPLAPTASDPRSLHTKVARPGAVAQARASLPEPLEGFGEDMSFGPEAPRGLSDLDPSPRQDGPRRSSSSRGDFMTRGLGSASGLQQQQGIVQKESEEEQQGGGLGFSGLPGMLPYETLPTNRQGEPVNHNLGMAQKQGDGMLRKRGVSGTLEEDVAGQLGPRQTSTPLSQQQQLWSGGRNKQSSEFEAVVGAADGSSTRSAMVQQPGQAQSPTTVANRLRKARANKVLPIAEQYRAALPQGID
jgi:hypothetical protein